MDPCRLLRTTGRIAGTCSAPEVHRELRGLSIQMIDAQTQERIRVFVPYPTLHGGALEPDVGFALVQT